MSDTHGALSMRISVGCLVVVREQPEFESALNSEVGEVNGGGGAGTFPGATPALNKSPIGAQQRRFDAIQIRLHCLE